MRQCLEGCSSEGLTESESMEEPRQNTARLAVTTAGSSYGALCTNVQKEQKAPEKKNSLHHKDTGLKVLMGIWRVTGSTQLQDLAVRNIIVFISTPDGNKLAGILNKMGMKLTGKLNGTLVVQSQFLWSKVSSAVPPKPRRMVWRATAFALISLHRSTCCRCAASNCCPGLMASQYLISIYYTCP
eukprot:1153493-Pelagomonas_calceolata.AAC.1